LKSMDQYTPYWRNLIFKLRQFFHGTGTHLTYDVMPDVVMNNSLWPYLDYISISAYMPLTLFKYSSVEQLQRGWNQHLDLLEKWLREKYPKKLVLFAEAGFMSLAGASQRPWDWKMYAGESEQEQADCMRASLLELPKRKWLKGAYYWRWTLQENYPLFNYDYYTPYKKKAEGVIREFWLLN
ncbi:MAG: hypothetical protein HY391_03720, partial [Deltaproteobacteria bacterium]|nr:hypothetical protein [Deltaproteobacteria bacterium]